MDVSDNVDKIIEETFEQENKDFELMKSKYKNMFNAITFNGMAWVSDQNLYSGLEAFQEIDNLVYIIGSNALRYLKNKGINTQEYEEIYEEMFCTHKGYIEYNDSIFEVEEFDGQGSSVRITLLEIMTSQNNKVKDKYVKIEDLINWMDNTDKWRMFQKIN